MQMKRLCMPKKIYRIEGKPQKSLPLESSPVAEFIDPVFAKTGSINSDTVKFSDGIADGRPPVSCAFMVDTGTKKS
jgi:hypothetical protein